MEGRFCDSILAVFLINMNREKDFAKRIMNERYGKGNYRKGPDTEFNKIKKWGDRAWE
ncbi:MAG: hypothetical protein K1060chlam3_00937 [Candidatus Anoxychlamydiales bacterium]|nr:hypothetical protein [Candidatus Anoxychlamydiales bacterium]